MEINYEVLPADQIIYWKKVHHKFIFSPYIFVCAIFLAIFAWLYSGSPKTESVYFDSSPTDSLLLTYFTLEINLLFFIGFSFLLRYRYNRYFEKTIRQNPGIVGKRNLQLLNDRLVFSTVDSKSEYQLQQFKKIEEVKDYYFLFTKKDKIVFAIIPKRNEMVNGFILKLKAALENTG